MSRPIDAIALRRAIHHAVIERALVEGGDLDVVARSVVRALVPGCDPSTERALVAACLDDVEGLGPFAPLLRDPDITEVMYNGAGRVFVERRGRLERVPVAVDDDDVVRIAQRVLAAVGQRVDRSAPIADARLADGSRVHVIVPPLTPDGPCFTIRRFAAEPVGLDAFDIPEPVRSVLFRMVRTRVNLLIAGGTSTGKTTFLNALGASIPESERIVTIEETAELRLVHPHVVRLEARAPNTEGTGGVAVRDLVRAALRMRPDRIIIGEVRGAEALDMVQAANTGHAGSMGTVHANGSAAALTRLEALALQGDSALPLTALRTHLQHAVHAVIVLERASGARRVSEVALVERAGNRLTTHPIATRVGGELHLLGAAASGAPTGEAA